MATNRPYVTQVFTCGKGDDVVHDIIELEGDSVNADCETIVLE